MPGFISHTVMARDIYNRINKRVSLDYLTTFSLGGDLSKYSKCRYDSHHKDMDKFIYNMADYIKNNKLVNNNELVGVLYAHICHYMMDTIIHPLVRKVDKACIKNKKNHALIEQYYDAYLAKDMSKYIRNRILHGRVNREVIKMLDYAYMKTYGVNGIGKYYRFNLGLYRLLLFIYRLFGYKFIYRISGVDKFILINKDIDLINNGDLNLDKLYDKSILDSIKYIDKIDRYLTNEQ